MMMEGSEENRFDWHIIQGSHASWKVMEFRKGIFQAWKAMENDCIHGKSWEIFRAKVREP